MEDHTKSRNKIIRYKYLCGIVGGLGPKASSIFYDQYIVDGRVRLFKAMNQVNGQIQSADDMYGAVCKISTARWTKEQVQFVYAHTASTKKLSDQDHIPIIIYGNSQIPGRPEFILNLTKVDPTEELSRTCSSLFAAGASQVAFACNTAHCFTDSAFVALKDDERMKQCAYNKEEHFLDMLELTFYHCIALSGKGGLDNGSHGRNRSLTFGLLATEGALKTNIFQNTADSVAKKLSDSNCVVGVSLVVPKCLDKFAEAVFGEFGIKAGYTEVTRCGHAQRNLRLLLELVNDLVNHAYCLKPAENDLSGAESVVVVLGCTELPLVISDENIDFLLYKEKEGKADGGDDLRFLREKKVKFVNPAVVLADEVLRKTLLSREDTYI